MYVFMLSELIPYLVANDSVTCRRKLAVYKNSLFLY